MDVAATTTQPDAVARLGRFVGFVLFATIGMGAIAAALLCGPVVRYWEDRVSLARHEMRIAALRQHSADQKELLANADHPAVIERAAIANLRYVPADLNQQDPVAPPMQSWPALERALAQLEDDRPKLVEPAYVEWARLLAIESEKTNWLLGLGGALVVVSLTCFSRAPREATD